MKRIISVILCFAMLLSMPGCATSNGNTSVVAVESQSVSIPDKEESRHQESTESIETETSIVSGNVAIESATTTDDQTAEPTETNVTESPAPESTRNPVPLVQTPQFDALSDNKLLEYIEGAVYSELVTTLNSEEYFVEGVTTRYISREYIEEVAYNSQANVFFGYSLAELNEQFQGSHYVFTLDDSGQTAVEKLIEVKDDTYDKVMKNVLIGSGVILVCVTVAVVTKNPAAAATAGKTVKLIFTASSMGAKAGTIMAIESAGFGGLSSAILEGLRTNDWNEALKAGMLGASEGYKFGAIFGTMKGIADGIRIVGNTRYFPQGSPQAAKYPQGVEYTPGANNTAYPRFEKWAKATAKFDTPTFEAAANHTGLSGNYYWDAKLANTQCGFSQTPSGYVWHHVEDMHTMILVPQDLHSVAMGGMSHTGGASLIRAFLGL